MKPARQSQPTKTPAKQLAGFIAKFDSAIAKQIRQARSLLRKRFPTAFELVYDNYNFFVIGYSPTERPSEALLSLTANSKGLGLCFMHGKKLPDPGKILQGSGNQTRFIRLETPEKLRDPAVEELFRAAVEQSKAPLRRDGPGRLIIRMISPKQRPRR